MLTSEKVSKVLILASEYQQVSIWYYFANVFHVKTFIYARVSHVRRRRPWSFLANFGVSVLDPWFVVGDFNSIMGDHEKCVRPPLCMACDDFREAIDFAKVLLIAIVGPIYMWACRDMQGFVARLLDTAFCSQACLGLWDSISCYALSRFKSDHNPLLLCFSKLISLSLKPFYFQSIWVNDDSFMALVDSIWSLWAARNAMIRVMLKLKNLK